MTVHPRPRARRRWAEDRGSATVEMTLATPLLVMVLFFVTLCGRLASVQMDLNAAAGAAARSASLAREPGAARAGAERTARESLAGGRLCQQVTVHVDTANLAPAGRVKVDLTCRVHLADLGLLRVPGLRVVTATATSPVDRWRARGGPS